MQKCGLADRNCAGEALEVGEVAATAAGNPYLLSRRLGWIPAASTFLRPRWPAVGGAHHARRPRADDDDIPISGIPIHDGVMPVVRRKRTRKLAELGLGGRCGFTKAADVLGCQGFLAWTLLKKPRSRSQCTKRSCQVPSAVKSRYCQPVRRGCRGHRCASPHWECRHSAWRRNIHLAHTAWTLSCQPAPAMKEGGASLGIGGTFRSCWSRPG